MDVEGKSSLVVASFQTIVPRADSCPVWCSLYISHTPLSLTATLSTEWISSSAKMFNSLQTAGNDSSFYLWYTLTMMESGSMVWGSREDGLSLALSLEGEWTGGPGIKVSSGQHVCAVVLTMELQHHSWRVGVESKASEWVCRSSCYHTWQRLVWDPVVHAAYVSSQSSCGQSDRGWCITHNIRLSATGCVWHNTGSSVQHDDLLPLILSDLLITPGSSVELNNRILTSTEV